MKKIRIISLMCILCFIGWTVNAQSAQRPSPQFILYSVYDFTGRLQIIGLPQAIKKAPLSPGLYIYTTSDNRRGKFVVQKN